MARTRRRSSRSRGRYERKIEHRQWFTSSFSGEPGLTLKAGSDTDNILKLGIDPLKGDDQTILRTRGYFCFYNVSANTSINCVLGGIVLPNKTANNASVSDLPNPLLDADSTDWFVWQPFPITPQLGASASDDAEAAVISNLQMPIDSKAKRIMEAAESVVWVVGFHPGAAISNKEFEFLGLVRTLVGY